MTSRMPLKAVALTIASIVALVLGPQSPAQEIPATDDAACSPGERQHEAARRWETRLEQMPDGDGRGIPAIDDLTSVRGDDPWEALLNWSTPLVQPPEGRPGEVYYDVRYSNEPITGDNWAYATPIDDELPDVMLQIPGGFKLDLVVGPYQEYGGPVATCDKIHMRAYLTAEYDPIGCICPISRGIPGQKIEFYVYPYHDTGADPVDQNDNAVYTTRPFGEAQWVSDDLTDVYYANGGEWFTCKVVWRGGSVSFWNGMVTNGPCLADSADQWCFEGYMASPYPNGWLANGGSVEYIENDVVFNFYYPMGAVGDEDVEIDLSVPMSIPPFQGANPAVPETPMVAFQLEQTAGPELPHFNHSVTTAVDYPDYMLEQRNGLGESSLRAYRYNEDAQLWELISRDVTTLDRVEHNLQFAIDELGLYALAAEIDQDDDGLGDFEETEYGTNPFADDTDGDGIGDGDEVWTTQANPLDPLKLYGWDQHFSGDGFDPGSEYFLAARIVAGEEQSPVSNCSYIHTHTGGYNCPGDVVNQFELENAQSIGVGFDGAYFWVSAGEQQTGQCEFYTYDTYGNLIDNAPQGAGATGWGHRDLAYDGTYMFGSFSNLINAFEDPATFAGSFEGPLHPNRAMAYDGTYFYTCGFAESLYRIEWDGVFGSTPTVEDLGGPWPGAYGLAYDWVQDCLWMTTADYSGIVYKISTNGYLIEECHLGPGYELMGGCTMAETDEFGYVFVALIQSAPDMLVFFDLGYEQTEPPPEEEFLAWQDVTGVKDSEAAWGDLDGDGDIDLAICGESDDGRVTLTYENRFGALIRLPNEVIGIQNQSSNGLAWGDYDGDGDLDLVLAGMSDEGRVARIYANNGGGTLACDSTQSLMGVSDASVAWGDYDGDGDLDLLVMGHDGARSLTTLYKNDPTGTLTPDGSIPLVGLRGGSADWLDFDGDGDLDLLLTGYDGAQRRTIFYENDPAGTLTDDGNHGLPGVNLSDVAWGDLDGDGDLDLAFTGEMGTGGPRTARIYRNDGAGGFTQVGDELMEIYRSSCAWGDYDNDGDLDVAFCGYTGASLHTKVYENTGGGFSENPFAFPDVNRGSLSWADVDGDGKLELLVAGCDFGDTKYAQLYKWVPDLANNAPSAPTDLCCQQAENGLFLTWSGAQDNETPEAGLYYCLRVGRSPGASNIVPGTYATPLMGNVGQATELALLRDVPPALHYWSVRTIDSGLRASPWSPEQIFVPPYDHANHDVGNSILTVTDQGILGFMDGAQSEGSGFIYPADGSNLLYVGSLWVGESESYVANRDYDADPGKEWIVSSDPDGHVWIAEDGTSDQDIHASYTDSAAAAPLGLFIDQESWAFGTNHVATNHVIICYTMRNESEDPLSDLYAGVFADLDFADYMQTTGAADPEHSLVYMTDPSGIHAGVQLLEESPGEPPLSNLTLIHNPTYTWPNSYILDADKFGFLSAAGPEYILTEAPDPDDYGLLASAGPFDLAPGEERRFAFALVGGESLEDLKVHAHVAQMIYQNGFGDAPDQVDHPRAMTRLVSSTPNPFGRVTMIHFDLAQPVELSLGIYDVGGRLVRALARGEHAAGRHELGWDSRDEAGRLVPGGVYFLRLAAGELRETRRLIRMK